MRCKWKAANVRQVRCVVAGFRHAIQAARRQRVAIIVDDVATVEYSQETEDETPVTIVCHASPVVTLTGEVREGFKGWGVILVNEHL